MIEVKKINYTALPGLSERQISEHHDVLYAGYVKKVNEIREKLVTVDLATTNATYSELRELKLELGFALNGVMLHELYFENMAEGRNVSEKLKKRIAEDFGGYEKWAEEFAALGISSRGWVILAENEDGRLENYICDMHNQGGIWGANPILVLDVYEHAYFLDYGTARKSYIEVFMQNINWDVVEERIKGWRK